MMRKPPCTYAQWLDLIDDFKDKVDDGEVIAAMKQGTLDWQPGVSERFCKSLIDAANFRMNAAVDRFNGELGRVGSGERGLVNAMITLRQEYATIANALNLQALPEETRLSFVRIVKEEADQRQKSLEGSASGADKTGRMKYLVKQTPVNKF